jgi:hypothetical protein
MKTYTNPYTQKIFLIINPLVGEILASGILKSQSQKLGINEDAINTNHLPKLAEGIKSGLVLFIGTELASQVEGKIKTIK